MLEVLLSADPSLLVLGVMAALVIATVVSWHRNKALDFQLQQCVVDSVTGKISIEKVGFMTALAILSWGFVAQVLRNQLTEWYALLYASSFVAARFGSSYLSVKKDIEAPKP